MVKNGSNERMIGAARFSSSTITRSTFRLNARLFLLSIRTGGLQIDIHPQVVTFPFGMKLSITAVFFACLQLALAPVCFCCDDSVPAEQHSCCHKEPSSPVHSGHENCPHCQEGDSIYLSLPTQGGFTLDVVSIDLPPMEVPEWSVDVPELWEPKAVFFDFAEPPPIFAHLNRAILGVFVV